VPSSGFTPDIEGNKVIRQICRRINAKESGGPTSEKSSLARLKNIAKGLHPTNTFPVPYSALINAVVQLPKVRVSAGRHQPYHIFQHTSSMFWTYLN